MDDWHGQSNQEFQKEELPAQMNEFSVEPAPHSATPELLQLLNSFFLLRFRDGLL
jgi:hypothetical protein